VYICKIWVIENFTEIVEQVIALKMEEMDEIRNIIFHSLVEKKAVVFRTIPTGIYRQ